ACESSRASRRTIPHSSTPDVWVCTTQQCGPLPPSVDHAENRTSAVAAAAPPSRCRGSAATPPRSRNSKNGTPTRCRRVAGGPKVPGTTLSHPSLCRRKDHKQIPVPPPSPARSRRPTESAESPVLSSESSVAERPLGSPQYLAADWYCHRRVGHACLSTTNPSAPRVPVPVRRAEPNVVTPPTAAWPARGNTAPCRCPPVRTTKRTTAGHWPRLADRICRDWGLARQTPTA